MKNRNLWRYQRVGEIRKPECLLSEDGGRTFLSMGQKPALPLLFDNPFMAAMYVADMERNGSCIDYSGYVPVTPSVLVFDGTEPGYYRLRPLTAVCPHCGRFLPDSGPGGKAFVCDVCLTEVPMDPAFRPDRNGRGT